MASNSTDGHEKNKTKEDTVNGRQIITGGKSLFKIINLRGQMNGTLAQDVSNGGNQTENDYKHIIDQQVGMEMSNQQNL